MDEVLARAGIFQGVERRDVSALIKQLKRVTFPAGDTDSVRVAGLELATALCRDLLDAGAPGLHFYTLNRSHATREIYTKLGLPQ